MLGRVIWRIWGVEETCVLHDYIVGGNAVGRDEEEGVVGKLVDVADFATSNERESSLQISCCQCHFLWLCDEGG